MKCSVIVPVYNPGPNLDRCVDSLLGQTMAPDDYEILLIDDGSTDGTADRLDALATAHPHRMRVVHLPGSGWPGTPRNVGLAAARGDYVHFVDNDDMLAPFALERLWAAAVADSADVVFGRAASDFRGLDHRLYRHDLRGVRLADAPLLTETLTPHKMFRRAFLAEHGIRFPEASPLEDQPFLLDCYIRAASISLLTDGCYYYYLRRIGSGRNAGDAPIDPAAHFAALEGALDVIDTAHAEGRIDDTLRAALLRRCWRVTLINPLFSAGMRDAPRDRQQAIFDTVRDIIRRRIPAAVPADAEALHRMFHVLVERGDLDAVGELAAAYREIRPRAGATVRAGDSGTADGVSDGGVFLVDVDATITMGDVPLRIAETAGGAALPSALSPAVPPAARLLGPDYDADAEVVLVSRADGAVFGLGRFDPGHLPIRVEADGSVRITGTLVCDPATALGGGTLTDGLWDLRLEIRLAGIARSCAVTFADPGPDPGADQGPDPGPVTAPLMGADRTVIQPFTVGKPPRLALDVGQWRQPLARTIARRGTLRLREGGLELGCAVRSARPVELELLATAPEAVPITLTAALSAASADARAAFALPAEMADGTWRLWLAIPAHPTHPAEPLPWTLRRADGRATLEQTAEPAAAR